MSLTDKELQALPRFVSIRQAANALDINYQSALRLIREGQFPLALVQMGSRNYVSKKKLLQFLADNA